MRTMAPGGVFLEDLSGGHRARRGVAKGAMALFVKHSGKHAAAQKAGFQKDDVIVELEGRSLRDSERGLLGRLLLEHQPGEQVKAAVLRGTERLELSLPMQ